MRVTGTILALDLATNTGWCAGQPAEPNPRFGHFTIPPTQDDVGRFGIIFEDWLNETIDDLAPALVNFEAPILPKQTQPMTVRKLTGLTLLTEMICRKRNIACRETRASTVKKHFAGSGRAEKSDTMAVCRRYGWRVRTSDEADACALWVYSVSCFGPDEARARFELGPLGARQLF